MLVLTNTAKNVFQRHVVVIDHRLVAERLRRLYIRWRARYSVDVYVPATYVLICTYEHFIYDGALDIRWMCMSRPHMY